MVDPKYVWTARTMAAYSIPGALGKIPCGENWRNITNTQNIETIGASKERMANRDYAATIIHTFRENVGQNPEIFPHENFDRNSYICENEGAALLQSLSEVREHTSSATAVLADEMTTNPVVQPEIASVSQRFFQPTKLQLLLQKIDVTLTRLRAEVKPDISMHDVMSHSQTTSVLKAAQQLMLKQILADDFERVKAENPFTYTVERHSEIALLFKEVDDFIATQKQPQALTAS